MVIKMTLYIDLIILLNIFLDFFLLFSVSLLLRRNIKLYKILLGAIMGGVSIISLFISFNSITLFIFKVFISIIMLLITFGFKSIKYFFNNFIYLYLISILLGGFLYFINDSFSYKNIGMVFFHNGFSINIVLVIILSPIMVISYVINQKKLKEEYSNNYEVDIILLNNKIISITGFLDTGNDLYDPYKKRPIIVINKALLKGYEPNFILVPCSTVNETSLLKCFKIKKLYINKREIKKECLVGISDNNFKNLGVELLLHKKLIREDL